MKIITYNFKQLSTKLSLHLNIFKNIKSVKKTIRKNNLIENVKFLNKENTILIKFLKTKKRKLNNFKKIKLFTKFTKKIQQVENIKINTLINLKKFIKTFLLSLNFILKNIILQFKFVLKKNLKEKFKKKFKFNYYLSFIKILILNFILIYLRNLY